MDRRELEELGVLVSKKGMVNLYHHTNETAAKRIVQTGMLTAHAEPHVYGTTRKEPDTGYGTHSVPFHVHHKSIELDDEFSNGRKDFRIPVSRPGGSIRVGIGHVREE